LIIKEILILDRAKNNSGVHDGLSGFFNLSKDLKSKKFNKVFIFSSSLRYLLISKIAGIKNISQYPLFRKKDNIVTSAKIFTENELGDIVSTQPELIISDYKVNKVKQKFNDKNIVKVKTYKKINRETFSVAKNFFRISKKNKNKNENCYQHIGIYIYKFEILKLFVSLKQTLREKKLKLEQLRALDNQIPINVVLAETKPMGIDTKSDFVKFKKILERNNF